MNKCVKRLLCVVTAVVGIAYAGYKLTKTGPEKHYPYPIEYTQIDPTLLDEVVLNGVRYLPPTDEYRLEVIGDRVSAVRKFYLVNPLKGFELKDGDVVDNGEVYRPLETRAEPVVADKQKTLGENGS